MLAAGFRLQGDLTRLPIAIYPQGLDGPTLFPPIIHMIPGGTPLPLNPPGPGALTATILQPARVRVGPAVGYMDMGMLDPGTVVVLTGRIKGNDWLQIEYPSGLHGRGWVSGELIKFDGEYNLLASYNQLATPVTDVDEAEVSAAIDTPPAPGEAPTPTADLPYGMTLAQINVRSGPASSFESFGLIDKGERVNLFGRTLNGLWFQIEYPAAPGGVAWVASEYVRVLSNISKLPYFNNDGSPRPKP